MQLNREECEGLKSLAVVARCVSSATTLGEAIKKSLSSRTGLRPERAH